MNACESFTDKKVLGRITLRPLCRAGRDSAVGVATRYELDGPGIKSRWGGGRFTVPVQTGRGAYPASCTMGTGSFPGVKRPGRGIDHPPPSSAEVKERVKLYLYSPSGPSWPVLGRTLPFFFTQKSLFRKFCWLCNIECVEARPAQSILCFEDV
jgi:hypothetical protein